METVKHQTFINALWTLTGIIFIIGVGVVLLYLNFQKNLFLQKLKQETLKNAHQSDLLRAHIEAQETERKRIAQDLHDELGAVLSIMRMHIMVLEQQDAGETQHKGLENVRKLSETALASVRNISHRLMPPQLETFGLMKTLESVAAQMNDAGSIRIILNILPPETYLPWVISLGLYRILMELINNTIKHAGATEINIDLYIEEQKLICSYEDNGCGLPEELINKGLGHKNIDGRITSLEGTFKIGNASKSGFYALIDIPLAEN